MMSEEERKAPHVVTFDGWLIGYGATRGEALQAAFNRYRRMDFKMQSDMLRRAEVLRLDDDEASEMAEMMAAEVV